MPYDWLHLSYHLPAGHPIGRSCVTTWLRRQHAVRETPELMQRWNFNVTAPFGDWLLGTAYRGRCWADDPVSPARITRDRD